MSVIYYEVFNPTSTDISNSIQKTEAPFRKAGTDDVWFLSYDNGYIPSNGTPEYHKDRIAKVIGKTNNDINKMPDPIALEDLRQRGEAVIEKFWGRRALSPDKRFSLHVTVGTVLHMLEIGDFPAAKECLDGLPTDAVFTSSVKSELQSEVDTVLDDYPNLKV